MDGITGAHGNSEVFKIGSARLADVTATAKGVALAITLMDIIDGSFVLVASGVILGVIVGVEDDSEITRVGWTRFGIIREEPTWRTVLFARLFAL